MRRNPSLWFGASCLLILLFIALAGPYLPFIDRQLNAKPVIMLESGGFMVPPYPPSLQYPLGSDDEGRDLLSLIVMGARETLWIVFTIVLLRYVVAIPLAVLSAFDRQRLLGWLIRKWNQMFSFLPVLVTAILYMNLPFVVFSDHRVAWAIAGLALLEAGRVSLSFQEQMFTLSKSEFVQAGIMIGNTHWRLFTRYYWPVLLPQIVVHFVQDLGKTMLLLGQLGFLGIYVEQSFVNVDWGKAVLLNESITWPQLLGEYGRFIRTLFFIPFWIALAISFAVFTFYWLGEGLRKHFEERHTFFRHKTEVFHWGWNRGIRGQTASRL